MSAICRNIIALLVILACSSGCDSSATGPSTHNPLLGSWQIVDQRMVDADIEIIWTFDGSSVVVSDGAGEIISQSPYTIDNAKDPHHITMQISDIVNEERPGIYVITNDQLELSFSVDGSPRPENVRDGESMLLKRVSP